MRSRDFVDSARIIGEKSWRIMAFEILPNLIPVVATSFLFTVIYGVGTYTALSFLGVISTSHWSWGTMLYWAQSAQAAQQVHLEWWWFLPPGLAVGLFGTGLALLNFGIDEFVNPRLRGGGAGGLSGRRARRAGLPRRPRAGPDARGPHGAIGEADELERQSSSRSAACAWTTGSATTRYTPWWTPTWICAAARCSAWPGRAAAASPPWPTRSPGCCGRRASSPRARRASRCRATLGQATRVGQPAHRRPARAAGAALERDRGGAAELDERPEPGAVHRYPVLRRAERAPAGHEPRRPAGQVGRAARDGGHSRRPAGQLPARAVRRACGSG